MSWVIRHAAAEDDAALRGLVLEAAMEDRGPFQLSYPREPSFLDALSVEGTHRQVGVAFDGDSGRLVACCTRTARPLFANGQEREVGYIGAMRIVPAARGGTLTARGWKWLREQHDDGRCPYYVTTILEGNARAIALLTSRRANLPTYHPMGRYVCLSLLLGRRPKPAAADVKIERGSEVLMPSIVECLRRHNARRQFAPAWHGQDFAEGSPLTRGFTVDRFLVARRGARVVGVLGAWDQRSFRQVTVERYGWPMRLVRALWNAVMPRCGYRRLPPVGGELPLLYAAFPAADDDDPAVFDALLRALLERYADGPHALAILGLHERDPLLPVARRFLNLSYASRVYGVYWDDGQEAFAALDSRVPYLEAGTL